jgi:hypothetical protein
VTQRRSSNALTLKNTPNLGYVGKDAIAIIRLHHASIYFEAHAGTSFGPKHIGSFGKNRERPLASCKGKNEHD